MAAAIITGTMARPSSPSVKFTALAAPAITKPPTTMKNRPNGISSRLEEGHRQHAGQAVGSSSRMISQVASDRHAELDRPGGRGR